MRECLGWVSTCADEKRCPMNWLEHAASELPGTARCHVCEHEVALVLDPNALRDAAAAGRMAALPVVPCAGAPALDWPGTGAGEARGNGAAGHAEPAYEDDDDRDSEPPPPPPPPPPPAKLTFFVTLLNGDTIKLDKDTIIVGRSRTCDVVIPSAKVSRQHASITRDGDDWYIEDLGSANGVWRAGEKVGRTKIEPGDVFTISEETLTFEAR